MARAAAKLCLASLALWGAAASQPSLDAEALFQKEARSHTAQFPGMPSIPGLPGMGGGAGASAGQPALPAPALEQVMDILSKVVAALKNSTMANRIQSALDEAMTVVSSSTQEMNGRFEAFNASVRQAATEDVIPLSVNFMEAEMEAVKHPLFETMQIYTKLMKWLPLGKKGSEAQTMIRMALPMLQQGMDDMMRPLKDSIEAMGNKSTAAFCAGALPLVINASASIAPMRQVEKELTKAMQQLPQMKSSPMAFMIPRDVMPRLMGIGTKMLENSQLMLKNFEAQAVQLNTTFRYALNEKLDCDVVIQSAAGTKGLGVLAALASLVAWLLL